MVTKTHRFWTQLGLVTILALTSVHVSIEETFPALGAPLNVTSSSFFSEGGPLHSNLSSVHEHATKSTSISTNAAVTRVFKMKLLHQTVDSKVDVDKQNNSVMYQGESHEQAYSSKREGPGPHNSLSSGSAGPPNETVQTKVLLSTIRPVNFSVLSKQVVSSISDASLHSKKKSKPYITYDEKDLPRDENGSIFLPKESPLGSGPSFDYVVPIVISMLAIPFLAILGAFFYKKACDFWDRRHYRRMDFLIDGMYND